MEPRKDQKRKEVQRSQRSRRRKASTNDFYFDASILLYTNISQNNPSNQAILFQKLLISLYSLPSLAFLAINWFRTQFSMYLTTFSSQMFRNSSEVSWTVPQTRSPLLRLTRQMRSSSSLKCLQILPSSSPSFSQNLSTSLSSTGAICGWLARVRFGSLFFLGSRRRGLISSASDSSDLTLAISLFFSFFSLFLSPLFLPLFFLVPLSEVSSSELFPSFFELFSRSSLFSAALCWSLRLNYLTSSSTSVRCWMGSQVQSLGSGQPFHRMRYIMPECVNLLSRMASTSQQSPPPSCAFGSFFKWLCFSFCLDIDNDYTSLHYLTHLKQIHIDKDGGKINAKVSNIKKSFLIIVQLFLDEQGWKGFFCHFVLGFN